MTQIHRGGGRAATGRGNCTSEGAKAGEIWGEERAPRRALLQPRGKFRERLGSRMWPQVLEHRGGGVPEEHDKALSGGAPDGAKLSAVPRRNISLVPSLTSLSLYFPHCRKAHSPGRQR